MMFKQLNDGLTDVPAKMNKSITLKDQYYFRTWTGTYEMGLLIIILQISMAPFGKYTYEIDEYNCDKYRIAVA